MKSFFILVIFFLGCESSINTKKFFQTTKEIDYTFDSGWKEAYSVKISSNGKCIIGKGRWDMKYYTGQLSERDITKLDSVFKIVPFEQYDSAYYEDAVDQPSYKIVLIGMNKDTITKFVYGRTAPKSLNEFSNQIRLIKESLKLTAKDTLVDFVSRKNFFPPTIKAQ